MTLRSERTKAEKQTRTRIETKKIGCTMLPAVSGSPLAGCSSHVNMVC
jgi:hypothetical protein